MKQNTKSKKNLVKAWAILNKNKPIAIEFGQSRPERFTIGTLLFFTDNKTVVPCEITCTI